jgi:hypothetical protein
MAIASHDIPELDGPGLRRFALATGAMLVLLFAVLLPWLLGLPWPRWPWLVGGALALWGLIAPASLGPLYRGWMRFGLVLSRVTTPLVLGIVFFGIFAPIALVMRLRGRDTMQRKLGVQFDSYRTRSEQRPRDSVTRPY